MGDFIIETAARLEAKRDGTYRPPTPRVVAPYVPFPVDVFPEPVASFVKAGAKAIGCDPAMIALPGMAVCGAAIGTTRSVLLKRSWFEPPIVWAAIVAPSGSLKSPAQDFATRALRDVQTRRVREFKAAVKEYRAAMQKYEDDLAALKKAKKEGKEPKPPAPPVLIRHVVSDTTVEALAPILVENPRGLLLCRDELAAWVGSFNQYKKGGSDTASWLELFRGGTLIVDRKSGDYRFIHVPHAAVSICGTIQPGTLRRVLIPAFFEAGLPARLLLAAPPTNRKRWTEADVEPAVMEAYAEVVDHLLSLRHNLDKDGEPFPVTVPLTVDSRRLWVAFYNQFAGEQEQTEDDDLRAAFAKIEGYAPRFALIFHCIREAAEPWRSGEGIAAQSMADGIRLARWFAYETERVYAMLRETDGDRITRELVEWIRSHGGRVTARELQQGCRRYKKSSEVAEAALLKLVQLGMGDWEPVPTTGTGGQPTRAFVLSTRLQSTQPPSIPAENAGSVDVDTVDADGSEAVEWTA